MSLSLAPEVRAIEKKKKGRSMLRARATHTRGLRRPEKRAVVKFIVVVVVVLVVVVLRRGRGAHLAFTR